MRGLEEPWTAYCPESCSQVCPPDYEPDMGSADPASANAIDPAVLDWANVIKVGSPLIEGVRKWLTFPYADPSTRYEPVGSHPFWTTAPGTVYPWACDNACGNSRGLCSSCAAKVDGSPGFCCRLNANGARWSSDPAECINIQPDSKFKYKDNHACVSATLEPVSGDSLFHLDRCRRLCNAQQANPTCKAFSWKKLCGLTKHVL